MFISEQEQSIDDRLANLKKSRYTGLVIGFSGSRQYRNDFETIVADYLALLKNGIGSDRVSLKILQTLDHVRAFDIATQGIRLASIGKALRAPWKDVRTARCHQHHVQHNVSTDAVRLFRGEYKPVHSMYRREPTDRINMTYDPQLTSRSTIMNLDDVLVLHLGLVGDDLVIALDSNLHQFVHGLDSVKGDQKVHSNAFADFSLEEGDLETPKIVFGPVVRSGARKRLVALANLVPTTQAPSSEHLSPIMEELEDLVGFSQLDEVVRSWARRRGRSLYDICLIIVPDGELFLLPLSFLGTSSGRPLIVSLGGVSIALSMIALKYSYHNYYYHTRPNMTNGRPRCSAFAADGNPPLDLHREMEVVKAGLGDENVQVIADRATQVDFYRSYSAGEICWFAGHGHWNGSTTLNIFVNGIPLDQPIPYPISGPVFADGILNHDELITTSNWNFTPLWLTVMNCCVLGGSLLVGGNPLGFMSALYSAGSIAAISAMFPVGDRAAVEFAACLSYSIATHFGANDFPRARALSEAIRRGLDRPTVTIWDFVPYALWGIP